MLHLYFAPLEGITTYPYRNLHHKYFGGVDTPEQLAALLRQSATTIPNPAALSAVGATFEKEVDADED